MSDIVVIGIAMVFLIVGIALAIAIHHEMKNAQKIWERNRDAEHEK